MSEYTQIDEDGRDSFGKHWVADLYGVDPELLDSVDELRRIAIEACVTARATILNVCAHHFEPYGVTVLVLLGESHFAIHTWPEHAAASVDLFTCGNTDVDAAFKFVCSAFQPSKVCRTDITRGSEIGK